MSEERVWGDGDIATAIFGTAAVVVAGCYLIFSILVKQPTTQPMVTQAPVCQLETEVTRSKYYGVIDVDDHRGYLSSLYEDDLEKAKNAVKKKNAKHFINDESPTDILVEVFYREVK